MPRYMTTYSFDTDKIEAFLESEDWQTAQELADEYVWQHAPDRAAAIDNHIVKQDEWAADQKAGRLEKQTY